MKIRLFFYVSVLILIPCSLTFSAFLGVKEFELNNGLKVIIIKNEEKLLVTQLVLYKVGAADDPFSKSGMAHFLEHMMFDGDKNSAGGQLKNLVNKTGGNLGVLTTKDYTYYYETVPKENLKDAMKLEAERMAGLKISLQDVKDERDHILYEQSMKMQKHPLETLYQALNAALFWRHPYGIPVLGWEEEIKTITDQDIKDFYQKWYVPNNAILIILGNINEEEIKRLAEEYYGKIPKGGIPKHTRAAEPKHAVQTHVKLYSPHISHSYLARSYYAPNFKIADYKYVYALQVLKYILSYKRTGLLERHLIGEQKLASHISIDYKDFCLQPRTFSFVVSIAPDCHPKEVETALDMKIKSLLKTGISIDELERGKHILLIQLDQMKTMDSKGRDKLTERLSVEEDYKEIEAWEEKIKNLTVSEVNDALAMVFNTEIHVTGYFFPISLPSLYHPLLQ